MPMVVNCFRSSVISYSAVYSFVLNHVSWSVSWRRNFVSGWISGSQRSCVSERCDVNSLASAMYTGISVVIQANETVFSRITKVS
jgi:hypothetical protein